MTDLVTGREAATRLDVPPKRVAVWIERGHVQPVGLIPGRSRGGLGVPVFHLDAFLTLADAYHERKRGGPCNPENHQGG